MKFLRFLRRLFFWEIVFVVLGGVMLHYQYEIPWISTWFGSLPGDMVAIKGQTLVYLPIASALAFSLTLNILFFLFRI